MNLCTQAKNSNEVQMPRHNAMWEYRRRRSKVLRIFSSGNKWEWVVRVCSGRFYATKNVRYEMDGKIVKHQSRYGRDDEGKNPFNRDIFDALLSQQLVQRRKPTTSWKSLTWTGAQLLCSETAKCESNCALPKWTSTTTFILFTFRNEQWADFQHKIN